MSDISRRNLLKGAGRQRRVHFRDGLAGACAAPSEPKPKPRPIRPPTAPEPAAGRTASIWPRCWNPHPWPDASTASNFNIIYDSKTTVGTTYRKPYDGHRGRDGRHHQV